MTDDYTKAIKERLAAATPAPWVHEDKHVFEPHPDEPGCTGPHIWDAHNRADGRFIANAPTDIANLLAEREVLREALKRVIKNENLVGGFVVEALTWKPGKQ